MALLRVVGPCPAGMPDRFSRLFHEGLSQEGRALEAPVHPRSVAAAFRHRRNASVLLELIGRGVAFALFAEGDEEPWGKDGASAWEGIKHGEVRMALGALRHGVVEGLDGVQGDAERGGEGLDQEGIGDDDTLIGGQWRSVLDGLEALLDDIGVAGVMRSEKALQGGAAREWCGLKRGPWGEKIAEESGVFVVNPLQDMRKVVVQGTAETVREAYFVAHEAAAMVDEWFEGAYRGALGRQRRELSAMFEQEFERELGVGGIVLGVAGCKGFTVPGERGGIDGKEYEDVILSQRIDDGAVVEFETDGDRMSREPLAQGTHPLIEGFWRVYKDAALACLGVSRLQADLVFGISPGDADERRTCIRRQTCHVSPPEVYASV